MYNIRYKISHANNLIFDISFQINSAPNNLDDQEIPKKLRLMIEAKSNYLEKRKSCDKYSPKAAVENIHQTENDKSSRLLDSTKHMGYVSDRSKFFK